MDEQFLRSSQNMEQFKNELEGKGQKPRFGQFSQPMPLTIGDSSTYYNKPRKDKQDVGKLKGMMTNKCRGTKDTFEKFKSNALGDDFRDPGQYFLRKDRKTRPQSQGTGFRPSGCNKTVKRSEFQYINHGPPPRPQVEKQKNFLTRFTYDPFQKQIPYMESEYDRKEDLTRNDYIMRRSQIITPDRPYTSTVRQRGTFYGTRTTFGTDREFKEKAKSQKKQPLFGPFKRPDQPHTGYNSTIGRNWPYIEDPEEDPIQIKKNVKPSIWKGPTYSQSSPIHTIQNYFRNTNKEYSTLLTK